MSWLPDLGAVEAAGAARLLAGLALKATVVLVAALALSRLLRRASAASRHLVWSGALAGLLLLPLAAFVLPVWSLPWLQAGEAGALLPETAVASPQAPLGSYLLLAWLCGAATVLARWIAACVAVWRLRKRAFPLDDPALHAEASALAALFGVRRPVTILSVRDRRVPLTWGIVRPVILLPANASEWSVERRRLVLAHELGHVARFDAASQVIAQVALALTWFHPLAWRAARSERAECERACDDLVLCLGARPSRYAGELLVMAQRAGKASRPRAVAAAMAGPSELEGRLVAILAPDLARGGANRGGACAVAAGLVAVLGLAMVGPSARIRPPDPPDLASPLAPIAPIAPANPRDPIDRIDPAARAAPPSLRDPVDRLDPPSPVDEGKDLPSGLDST